MDKARQKYKEFIDHLLSRPSKPATLESLAKHGFRREEGIGARALAAKLQPDEVEQFNGLLRFGTEQGMISVLVMLSDAFDAGRLILTWHGVRLPVRPFGDELWMDFDRRQRGEPWPDESVCPVHQRPLQIEPVPILYGLPSEGLGMPRARLERFPLANAVVLGGCCVTPEKKRNQPFCDECRRELVAWCKENRTRAGLPRQWKAFMTRSGGKL